MIDYRVGDVRHRLAEIPDGAVSLVATSPPFIALRSYLPADHPDKHLEIGSEPDPASFIDTLLGLTAEWGRVLAPWGSIAIELGDTYAGSGGAGGDYNEGGLRDGQQAFGGSARKRRGHNLYAGTNRGGGFNGGGESLPPATLNAGPGWPRAKCLALVPQLYAASLAYGRNLLTGQPSPAGQWLVRNVIVWHRPNPAVGALGDKVRPSTSYIVVATRSPRRWFDLTAVRGDPSPNTHARTARGVESRPSSGKSADRDGNYDTLDTLHSTAGAPPLDCWFDEHDTWTITTQPSRLAHFAMWPPRLAERLVLMMCPKWVCRDCARPLDSEYVRTSTMQGVREPDRGSLGAMAGRAGEPAILFQDVCEQGDCQGTEVHDLSTIDHPRVRRTVEARSPNGEQSRVRDGASVRDGGTPRPTVDAQRGCPSPQRDQDGQSNRESGSSEQTGTRSEAEAEAATLQVSELRRSPGELRDSLACPACGSRDLARGVVLDPFCGTGTTLCVADLHGRDAIGIDLDARNAELVDARMAECRRALFGVTPELPGQLALSLHPNEEAS